jgi:hypothetical protein
VVEAELNSFSAILELVSRVDVMERGAHPSVWLTFQKRETQP